MNEERIVYLTLILAGLPPVIGWLVQGGPAGAGFTICCLLIFGGICGLVSGRPQDQPTAKLARKSPRP
ncbi:MAG: hypothetical protein ABI678_14375 [Kofleriaceae bacterium]